MTDGTKRILWLAVRLLVVAGLVAYVVSRTDAGQALDMARRLQANWWLAVAALAVMMLQAPLSAIRWQGLLAVQGIRIPFLESLRLTYIGWFFNNWMPGATGGDLIKAYYIARQTHRKAEAVTVVFLDRVIGLVALCMMGAAAVAVSYSDERVRVAQVLVLAFLGAVAAGGIVFYSSRIRSMLRVGRFFNRLKLWPMVVRVERAIFIYRDHKRRVAVALAYSWLVQAAGVLAIWWVAAALGSRAAWYQYFVNMPVVWIGWSLVPVPGGFGVAEALVQRLFGPDVLGGGAAMAPAEAATLALAMILAYRVVQMVASLPGAVLYLTRRTDVSAVRMRDEMEAPAADA